MGGASDTITVHGARVLGRSSTADDEPRDQLVCRAGRIVDDQPPDGRHIDATGLLAAPGLIDLQVNGVGDIDLATEPERIPELGVRLAPRGVTAFLPTLVTSPPWMRARARDAIAGSRVVPPAAAAPLGWHLEGPFLAERRRGAHPSEWLESITDDNASAFDAGWVRMITLAPELPGALALIRALCTRGITVSIGHTDATHGEMRAAIEAGARLITHLFNAMAPFHHREPGPIGVALTDPRVSSSLIVDDIHVHQAAVQLAWQALAPQRLVLVSDSVGAASTADGVVRLGDGTLAGSRIGLLDAVRNLTRITGCGPDAAIACATAAPARVLGLRDRGHLDPGAVADVILLTPELDLAGVIVRGNVLLAP